MKQAMSKMVLLSSTMRLKGAYTEEMVIARPLETDHTVARVSQR
jgi:hypothetical protein